MARPPWQGKGRGWVRQRRSPSALQSGRLVSGAAELTTSRNNGGYGNPRVDFVDPALRDQHSQFTEAAHYALTPGATEVYNLTFLDFPTGQGVAPPDAGVCVRRFVLARSR